MRFSAPHLILIMLLGRCRSFSTITRSSPSSSRRGMKIPRQTQTLLYASTTTTTTTPASTRLSREDLSLDARTIATRLEVIESHLKARRASAETVEAAKQIASLFSTRNELIQQRDQHLNQRKEASAIVGKLMRNQDSLTDDQQQELEKAKETSSLAAESAAKAEEELESLQTTIDQCMAGIPNLLDDRVPDGEDDSVNEEVAKWGDIEALPKELGWTEDFKPLWHDEVAQQIGGYQAEAAVKMSGARFVALSGEIARLERAIAMFFVDLHVDKHGYTEVSVPFVVSRSSLEGTSQLPKFEEDLFSIKQQSHTCNGEDAFLIPTAEVPVTNLHRDSVLEESDLPKKYVAFTPCFRAEAGSHGRDTKGLIRQHQFSKVELVKITTPESSDEEHEALTKDAETCLQLLKLPYRKVRLCSGDIGFSARHCYDLEVWLPGAGEYREISSCSNTGDFQANRMSLRYRPKPEGKKKSKPVLCHTINGSGLAVGRTLVAVLENYQQPDGSLVIPEVLRPYMGGKEVIKKSN